MHFCKFNFFPGNTVQRIAFIIRKKYAQILLELIRVFLFNNNHPAEKSSNELKNAVTAALKILVPKKKVIYYKNGRHADNKYYDH